MENLYKWLNRRNPVRDIHTFYSYFFDDKKVVWIDNAYSKQHSPVKQEVFESGLIKAIFGRTSRIS